MRKAYALRSPVGNASLALLCWAGGLCQAAADVVPQQVAPAHRVHGASARAQTPPPAAAAVDVSVVSFQLQPFAVSGTRLPGMTLQVKNDGPGATGTLHVYFFMGRSPSVTPSDIDTTWSCTFDSINAGSSAICSGDIDVPAGLASGSYYMAALADPLNTLGDSNLANNTRVADTGPLNVAVRVAGNFDASDGASPLLTNLQSPEAVRVDRSGNIFIADSGNHRIRKVVPGGAVTTVLGNGTPAFAGDLAWLKDPEDLNLDAAGNLYVADTGRHRVLKLSTTGAVTVLAGTGVNGFSGDNGSAASAALSYPDGVCADASGNVYISDWGNGRVRKVNPSGIITTFASISNPAGLAIDSQGLVYVSDYFDGYVWTISPGGAVQIFAGTGATTLVLTSGPAASTPLGYPNGLAFDGSGSLYVTTDSSVVWRIDSTRNISVYAGSPNNCCYSGDGGLAQNAYLSGTVWGVGFDSAGNGYIADSANNSIRKVTSGIISRYAGSRAYSFNGDGADATQAALYDPGPVAVDASGNVYISDVLNWRVRKVTPGNAISTVAGNGNFADSGDGGVATAASFELISGIAVDSKGAVYVADLFASRVRKIGTNGVITTVAGTGSAGKNSDRGAATSFQLRSPDALAIDGNDNLYIADTGNYRVVRVGTDGIATTIAGNGVLGDTGDNGAATSASLLVVNGLTVDTAGNVYIAQGNRVRKVSQGGIITAFAGNGVTGSTGDGNPASAARFVEPTGLATDSSGNVYIVDRSDERVRVVNSDGVVRAYLSSGHAGFGALNNPGYIAADRSGTVIFSDRNNHRVLRYGSQPTAVCTYTLSATSANYAATGGAGSFTVTAGTGCSWSASSGQSWIHISSGASYSGSSTVSYSVDSNTATAARQGTIAAAGGQFFTIVQSGASPAGAVKPVITQGGVVEPWTYIKGIAPGAWVSIYGTNLSSGAPVNWSPQPNAPIATTLGNVSVTVDGVPAALQYVSPTLVNLLVPGSVREGSITIVVTNQGVSSDPFSVVSTRYLPAIYANAAANSQPPRFYVTAVNAITSEFLGRSSVDGRVARGARPGDTVDLYAIGLGPTTPAYPSGSFVTGFFGISGAMNVVLGNTQILPQFAALVSPGLYQVRFVVPANTPSGDLPIQLDFGAVQSATSVYLTVQP
jgi:uncharacterized protein (TIGR03437 family)